MFNTDNWHTKLTMLFFPSDVGTPEEMCRTKYPAKPCREDYFAYTGWYQMGENRCVKAFFNSQHKGFFDAEVIKPNTHIRRQLIWPYPVSCSDRHLPVSSTAKDARREDLRKFIQRNETSFDKLLSFWKFENEWHFGIIESLTCNCSYT